MRSKKLFLAVTGAFAVVLLVIAVQGLRTKSPERNTISVPAINGIASLEPGGQLCQEPVGIDAAFSQVALAVSTAPRDSRPTLLRARVLELPSRREIAGGTRRLTVQEARSSRAPIALRPTVAPDRLVAVCFANEGSGKLGVLGDFYATGLDTGSGAHPSQTASTATLNGIDTGKDAAITFPADPPPSRLSQIPSMIERASRFRPAVVGPWAYWLLFGLALVAGPALLWRALAASAETAGPDS